MNAFTPPITVSSIVTPSFSRASWRAVAPAADAFSISCFHSAALFGFAFQFGTR